MNETYDDDSSDETSEFDFLSHIELININPDMQYGHMDIRDGLISARPWGGQRELNLEHVNNLVNGILKSGCIYGTIQLQQDLSGRIRVMDGQHRIAAIKKIFMRDDVPDDITYLVLIVVYQTDDIDSTKSANYFNDINTNLTLSPFNISNIKVQKIVEKLVSKWPEFIVDVSEGSTVYRPRFNKKDITSIFKVLNSKFPNEELYKHFIKYVKHIGTKGRQDNVSDKLWNKIKKYGFWVGQYKFSVVVRSFEIYLTSKINEIN